MEQGGARWPNYRHPLAATIFLWQHYDGHGDNEACQAMLCSFLFYSLLLLLAVLA